jgi:hypothetical protein
MHGPTILLIRALARAVASEEMVEISGERRAGATGDESGAGAPR